MFFNIPISIFQSMEQLKVSESCGKPVLPQELIRQILAHLSTPNSTNNNNTKQQQTSILFPLITINSVWSELIIDELFRDIYQFESTPNQISKKKSIETKDLNSILSSLKGGGIDKKCRGSLVRGTRLKRCDKELTNQFLDLTKDGLRELILEEMEVDFSDFEQCTKLRSLHLLNLKSLKLNSSPDFTLPSITHLTLFNSDSTQLVDFLNSTSFPSLTSLTLNGIQVSAFVVPQIENFTPTSSSLLNQLTRLSIGLSLADPLFIAQIVSSCSSLIELELITPQVPFNTEFSTSVILPSTLNYLSIYPLGLPKRKGRLHPGISPEIILVNAGTYFVNSLLKVHAERVKELKVFKYHYNWKSLTLQAVDGEGIVKLIEHRDEVVYADDYTDERSWEGKEVLRGRALQASLFR